MSTIIRPEISKTNKYWISRHRYYELKHFCLQYNDWKKGYNAVNEILNRPGDLAAIKNFNPNSDPTSDCAIAKVLYRDKMEVVEKAALATDGDLYVYILKGVTEGLSYNYLWSKFNIPCCKDTYYDRYRKFFWTLNKLKV